MLKNGNYSAHELQRIKVQLYSQFGIWSDDEQTIEFKISPSVGGAKIKIWTVHDFNAIKRISSFCGLNSFPKRTNWQGFDLVTNLQRKENDWFVDGVVHMPNNKRKNIAEFKIIDSWAAELNFFYYDSPTETLQNKSGFIFLTQKKNHALDAQEEFVNIP